MGRLENEIKKELKNKGLNVKLGISIWNNFWNYMYLDLIGHLKTELDDTFVKHYDVTYRGFLNIKRIFYKQSKRKMKALWNKHTKRYNARKWIAEDFKNNKRPKRKYDREFI